MLETWKQQARRLKLETYAIYLAYQDPRVPWYARLVAACVVGYAFSPIDLIPDPIPILGYADDLILIPLGIALARKLIPPPVMAQCREKAQGALDEGKPTHWVAAGIIVIIWLFLAALIIIIMLRVMYGGVTDNKLFLEQTYASKNCLYRHGLYC